MPAVKVVNWSYFKETLSASGLWVSISTTVLIFVLCLLSTECMTSAWVSEKNHIIIFLNSVNCLYFMMEFLWDSCSVATQFSNTVYIVLKVVTTFCGWKLPRLCLSSRNKEKINFNNYFYSIMSQLYFWYLIKKGNTCMLDEN